MYFTMHFKTVFGGYMKAHDDPTIKNYINPRTNACIELGATVNILGNQKLFYIYTGKVLNKREIIPIPIPYHVINKWNGWGRCPQLE